jgi:hypothetical protein
MGAKEEGWAFLLTEDLGADARMPLECLRRKLPAALAALDQLIRDLVCADRHRCTIVAAAHAAAARCIRTAGPSKRT